MTGRHLTSNGRASGRPAVETMGLTKFYGGVRGVEDVDLTVAPGEVFGLLGPNGAGKTTLIRLLLGLVRPSRGRAMLLGRVQDGRSPQLRGAIGYLPGECGFYGDLTGEAYLEHFARLRGGGGKGSRGGRSARLLERLRIDLSRKIKTYSRGMKQILGILQAFQDDPPLLVLDEPTAGLDPLMQEAFLDLVREEKERGKTFFLSSHNLREVERVCDRLAVIGEGRLLTVEDVDGHRTRTGKSVRLVVGEGDRPSEALAALTGVEELRSRGAAVEFFYKGRMGALMERVAALDVRDFSCETPSLEDVFLRYYGRARA